MAKWFPSPDETFVYGRSRWHHGGEPKRIVLLIPGGEEPETVEIDGETYKLDEDMTEKTHMYVRVAERKRTETPAV